VGWGIAGAGRLIVVYTRDRRSNVAPSERTELLTVRVTPEELAMLKRLAEADGVSSSDLVRQFVRRSHEARFGQPKAPRQRPKPKPKK
jgi:hypothetical protein